MTAAGIALYAGNAKADDATLTAATIVYQDLHSDTRAEVESGDLEGAVEQLTSGDYEAHETLLGARIPIVKDLQLRQTGLVDYGNDFDSDGDDTEGSFDTNVFYSISDEFRVGAGGGADFPSDDWIAHGNFGYFGELLNTQLDVLHHDASSYPVDGRGYASVLFPNKFYVSAGKSEELNFFNILGYIGGKGEFNLREMNSVNAEDQSSRHKLVLTWNSTKDRGCYDFFNHFEAGVEGYLDMLHGMWDPTIGFVPVLSNYGEYGIELDFKQNSANIGGGVMLAYNPDNAGTFVELGSDYSYTEETDDGDVSVTMTVGADLDLITGMASITQEVTEPETRFWVYLGKDMEL
jgi:hypothetical protein